MWYHVRLTSRLEDVLPNLDRASLVCLELVFYSYSVRKTQIKGRLWFFESCFPQANIPIRSPLRLEAEYRIRPCMLQTKTDQTRSSEIPPAKHHVQATHRSDHPIQAFIEMYVQI